MMVGECQLPQSIVTGVFDSAHPSITVINQLFLFSLLLSWVIAYWVKFGDGLTLVLLLQHLPFV